MKYAIPDPWLVSDSNPFDFDIEAEGRRRQANAKGLNRVKPNAAQKAATRREISKWREAAKLSREFNKFKKDYGNAQHEIKKFQRATTQNISKVQKALKPIQDAIKKIPGLAKVADNLKIGNFSKVMPKKSASGLVLIAGIAAAALGVVLINKQNEIWEYDARAQAVREASINADFQFSLRTRSKLNTLEAKFNKLKQDLDATKKGLYGDVQNLINNLPKVRKTANDALYEVRQGRKILDGQIAVVKKTANDALYEVRQGRKILDGQIVAVKKTANDALYEVRQGRVKLDSAINSLKSQVNGIFGQITGIKINSDKVPRLEAKVNALKTDISATDKAKIDKAASDANKALSGLNGINPTINKAVNDQVGAIRRDIELKLGLKLDKTALLPSIQANIAAIFSALLPSIRLFVLPLISTAIAPLTAIDAGFKLSIDLINAKVNTQDVKIQDISKVNAEGNAKLDRLLPLVLGFPALISQVPQGTIDKFNQQVAPKIPDMAAAGTCKTLQPGGCMRNGLDLREWN